MLRQAGASKLRERIIALVIAGAIGVFCHRILTERSDVVLVCLLLFGACVLWLCGSEKFAPGIRRGYERNSVFVHLWSSIMVVAVALSLRADPFALHLLSTALIFAAVSAALNLQFGFCGVLNFSAAGFFGLGAYTAALLSPLGLDGTIVLLAAGVVAGMTGFLLALPIVRTRGHYAAVITIAFGIMFRNLLEVTDAVGGPQGLKVDGLSFFGYRLNENLGIYSCSFFFNYVLVSLALLAAFVFVMRRIDGSFVGIGFDSIRLDETTAACFGLDIWRWKLSAFTMGNAMLAIVGALYGSMLGYVAPSNFSFSDSLIFVSIIILGGIGSVWGGVIAAVIVVLLSEKLQPIQEYRFLIFSTLVVLVLLFRPQGLMRRPLREFSQET